MPISALPEHLNSREEIETALPDDSQYGTATWYGRLYKWWNKTTKTWFAFSYRCTESWARWRKTPKILLAFGGTGPWRWEHLSGKSEVIDYDKTLDDKSLQNLDYYLSRIQYYKRWHVAIMWPLMFTAHWYTRNEYVPKIGEQRPPLKGKLWFAYYGHYDADNVYWMITSAYFGSTWK